MKNLRMTIWMMILVCCLILSRATGAVIYDHFDDGVLGSEWDVSFAYASGWTYSETGTNLTVTDITIDDPDGSSSQNSYRAMALLNQSVELDGDFRLDFGFSWDSEGQASAIQDVIVLLFNDGVQLGGAGYNDGWVGARGNRVAKIGNAYYESSIGSEPYSGSAIVRIERINGNVKVLWDDDVLLDTINNGLIDQVQIRFNKGTLSSNTFGSLSVDYINVVPEPSTLLMLGLGGLFLRRKK